MLIATDQKPATARALAEQLESALTRKDFEAAFAATEAMIECWPESAGAWTAAGLMALKLGRLEDASYRLGSALTLAPTDLDAHYNLAMVDLQRGETGAALKRLRGLCRDHSDNADLFNDIGVMWHRTSRPSRALASFVRSLRIDPNHADARENTLELCLENGWTELGLGLAARFETNPAVTADTGREFQRWRLKLTQSEKPETQTMAARPLEGN